MAQSIFGVLGGRGMPAAGHLKEQLQQSCFDEEFEPTSVLELSSCISPPLQEDVWAEQQALAARSMQAQYMFEQQKAQYAWEQQQQLIWEHQQQQQLLLWEQQYQQQQQFVMGNVDPIATALSSQAEQLMWDADYQQQQQQQQLMQSSESAEHPWLQSTSDFSCENSSSANFQLLDDPFNFEAWISSESSKSVTEESVGSFVVNDIDESTPYLMADEVSSNPYENYCSGLSPMPAPAAHLPLAAGSCEWGDELMQNVRPQVDERRTSMNEDLSCLPINQPKLSASMPEPQTASQQPWMVQQHQVGSQLRQEQDSPGLLSTMSPSSSPYLHNQNQFRLEVIQPATAPSIVHDTSYSYKREQMKLSSERRGWQSNPSIVPAAAGTYHGGMITQFDMSQGAGRMGVETSSVRARIGIGPASIHNVANGETMRSGGEQFLNVRSPTASETQNVGGALRMVQLLLACAEAVACRDSRQAAILLQQLQHMATPHGDSMQRVTSCFVEGLTARLAITGSQPLSLKSIPAPQQPPNDIEKQEGFKLIHKASPYVAFGHFAANSAILEAFEGENALHIVDLGMTNALQWPHLIHGLAIRRGGPPRLLRITAFGLATEKMREAGQELTVFAEQQEVNFEFKVVTESLENLQRSMLEIREGESLAVNSLLQLHCVVKESRGSLNAVLQSIHELSPKILTLVEQDASHNGPFFLGRFMEALHYYSAIFDSLDAILPRDSLQRVKMEQNHFAEEIKNIVSCEGPARVERHERVDQWRRRMSRAGFQSLPLKFLSQARSWLGYYSCDGYTLTEEKGCLVLGWKGKPLIAASSWQC